MERTANNLAHNRKPSSLSMQNQISVIQAPNQNGHHFPSSCVNTHEIGVSLGMNGGGQASSRDSSQTFSKSQQNYLPPVPSTSSQQTYDSLMALYADNYCHCTSNSCKKVLSSEFQKMMKENLSKSLVNDMINIMTGSAKSQKSMNLIWYFLQYMALNTISKNLMDDLLRFFVVLYLKSSSSVKLTLIEDLDNIFLLIKGAETKLFVDGQFKYRIFFHGICQFKHCARAYEQGGKDAKLCDILSKSLGSKRKGKKQGNLQSDLNADNIKSHGCSIHGNIDIKENIIDLTSKRKFIPFICFLAQLNFKILNIEDRIEALKESRRKFICNLLFSMIEHCKSKHYYYPLRALTEFFLEEENEKALSKRLNSESLLNYKKGKEILGREIQLLDFNKRNLVHKKGDIVIGSGYKYLYSDTLNLIRGVLSKLEQEQHLDCFILCLKILSKILKYEIVSDDYKHNAITLYIDCLVTVSQNLIKLNQQEKECYYSEVKNLIKIIQSKQQELRKNNNNDNMEMMDITGSVVNNENNRIPPEQDRFFYNVGSKFVPKHIYNNMDEEQKQKFEKQMNKGSFKSQQNQQFQQQNGNSSTNFNLQRQSFSLTSSSMNGMSYLNEYKNKQKYPNLSVLKHLITIQSIQQYPKLALLIFEALFPYIEVFNNNFISFINMCQQNRLIVNEFKNDDSIMKESLKKKIKLCDGASAGREVILNFYIKGYKQGLENIVKQNNLQQVLNNEMGNHHYNSLSMQELLEIVESLDRKRQELSREETMFIVDFLLQLCKHAQIFDEHAISLGTHLLQDFYPKTNKFLDQLLSKDSTQKSSDLMFVNFDLRSKVFISQIIAKQKQIKNVNQLNDYSSFLQEVKDDIFNNIFVNVYEQIINKSNISNNQSNNSNEQIAAIFNGSKGKYNCMEEYTTHFLKQIIKIFQHSRRFLNLKEIKKMIDQLVTGEKLIVTVNGLPLYLVTQMFFDSEQINEIEDQRNNQQGLIVKIFDVIQRFLEEVKNFSSSNNVGNGNGSVGGVETQKFSYPMLHFYRIRNLINSFTCTMKYLLCFQTPLQEKTSSSHMQSIGGHSQTQHSSTNTSSSYFSQNGGIQLDFNYDNFENSFVVKRQKRCNFCGDILTQPKKFTFSRKCPNCAIHNSTFIFPARFLCNMCIDTSANDIFRCTEDQIPLDSIRDAQSLQSEQIIKSIQRIIQKTFEIALEDWKDQRSSNFYFDGNIACMKKIADIENLYSQLLTHLLNRMLKIMRLILNHELPIENSLLLEFKKLKDMKELLTDSFALTKERIKDVDLELKVQGIASSNNFGNN